MIPAGELRFACREVADPVQEDAAKDFLHAFCREWRDELDESDAVLVTPRKSGMHWTLTLSCGGHSWIFRRHTAVDLVQALIDEVKPS